jgi:hypothetical protein
MKTARACAISLLLSLGVTGCDTKKPNLIVDPNVYPANYRTQIATLLLTTLRDPADFRASLIAPPALKPVGDTQLYIVCVELGGSSSQHRDKAALYLNGSINQFVDATPDQCAGAPYEPFKELAALAPR